MKTSIYQIVETDPLKYEINIIGEISTYEKEIDPEVTWHLCNYSCWNNGEKPASGEIITFENHDFIPTDKFLGYVGDDIAFQVSIKGGTWGSDNWAIPTLSGNWHYCKDKTDAMKYLKVNSVVAKIINRRKKGCNMYAKADLQYRKNNLNKKQDN